ncbi:MAG: hypothetical protein ACJ71B_09515 [Nitrososphaera sp.]
MKFFDSKNELKDHINKNLRITNEKMIMVAAAIIYEKTSQTA